MEDRQRPSTNCYSKQNRPLLPCSSRLSASSSPTPLPDKTRDVVGGSSRLVPTIVKRGVTKKLGDGQGDRFNRIRTAFGNTRQKWNITDKGLSFGRAAAGGNALIGRLSGTGAQQSTDRSDGTVGQPFRGCQSWQAVIDRKVGRFTSSTVASSLLAAYLGKFVDDSSPRFVPLFSISLRFSSSSAQDPDLKIVRISNHR